MEISEKNEIVITFAKLRDNLIRFWWIIAVGILLAIAVIIWSGTGQGIEGETTVSAEMVFCFEENGENIDEGKSGDQLLAEVLKEKSEKPNYTELSEMAIELMKTQTSIEEINKEMLDAGFENYQFNVNQVDLEATDRLLVCVVEGENANEVIALSQIYSDLLINKMSLLEKNATLTILQGTDQENLIEDSGNTKEAGVLSVKNVFILCLFLMGAVLVIFFLMLKDRYIRSKDEVDQLKEKPVLGELKPRKKTNQKEDLILPEYMKTKGFEQVALVKVCGKKIAPGFIKQVSDYCSEKIGGAIVKEAEMGGIKATGGEDNKIVLVISINDDHIEDVEKLAEKMNLLNMDIIGVIYVYP
ncbi:hypothetical protein FND36_06200 [Lachnospiraceae bacterium KGMB03038]|nr:hypothetical protein FND36_06200 [Lachnospiraceae bacterium KGMB03038]